MAHERFTCLRRLRRVQLAGSLWRWRQSAKRDLQKALWRTATQFGRHIALPSGRKTVAFGKCRMEETLSSRTFPFPSLSCKQQMGHLDGMNMRPACSHCTTMARMSCLKRRQLADLGWKSIYEAHYFTSPLFRLATYRGCCIHKIQLRQFTRVGVRVDQN